MSPSETFTDAERARLAPYFTNLDGHVFALTNLPETVKGALFARYSRSAKSLRRLFLDEFSDSMQAAAAAPTVAAPNLGALTSAATTAGATTQAASEMAKPSAQAETKPTEELPSIVTVEVLGYGGSE